MPIRPGQNRVERNYIRIFKDVLFTSKFDFCSFLIIKLGFVVERLDRDRNSIAFGHISRSRVF